MKKIQVYLIKRQHGIWYLYYTDAEGKYKGKSLGTKNEREARSKRRQFKEELEREIYNKLEMERLAYLEKVYANEIADYEKDPTKFWPIMMDEKDRQIAELEAEVRRLKGIQSPEQPAIFSFEDDEAEEQTNTANPSIKEFWDRFHTWAEQNKAPSTVYSYAIAWKKLLKHAKPKHVLDITPEKIQAFVETLKRTKLKDKTINHHLIALQTIFNYSITHGFFTGTNPVPDAKKKVKLDIEASPKAKALTTEQFTRLLEIAKSKTRDIYLAVAIAGYSGLRKGEIANLRWEDIDLEAGTLSVTKKAQDISKGIAAWTAKTKSSYRTVQLFPELKEILPQYKRTKGYVIEGKGLNRAKWALPSEFEQVRKEFNISWFAFHDLRHTFASLLLNQGIDIHVVARLLGHASVQVTYDTYFHMLPDMYKNVSLTSNGKK